MTKTALVLITALVVGASVGFFAHEGAARQQASKPPAARVAAPRPERLQALLRPERASIASTPAVELGPPTMSVPRLHLRSRVFPADRLNSGPAWWPVTGRPGGGDTVAVAGHRTTHTHPFYYLDRLRRGDAITLTFRGRVYRYRVVTSRVLPATDVHMADAVGHERLLLSACTPRGSAAFRLVVEARPVF